MAFAQDRCSTMHGAPEARQGTQSCQLPRDEHETVVARHPQALSGYRDVPPRSVAAREGRPMAHDGTGVDQNALIKVRYDFLCEGGPEAHFRVYRMRLMEDINDSYELDLDLVTDQLSADTDLLLGAACQVDISRGDHVRTVYGIVMAVDYGGHSEDYLLVNVRVVPAFQLLGQQTHSRIFQDMSVLQILDEVLGAELARYGRTFAKGAASRGTSPRDYCVQYRESDHDFCVRLMEEEGISYHFVHDESARHEVLTLSYENSGFRNVENVDGTAVVSIIHQRPETADTESIQSFDFLQVLTSTSVMRRDYDFMTPLEPLDAKVEGTDPKGRSRRLYFHTDRRFTVDDVAARNQDHLEAAKVHGKVGRGTGNVTGFAPGLIFELERHVRDELETKFLVTRVVHAGECPEELLSTAEGSATSQTRYGNSFCCIPLDVPMRPTQTVAKPRVHGLETAIVTGTAGEEIHVDEHGRIKVQFHWEEGASHDDTSSCWVRVRQQWSGPGWGFQFIPRVGQEVLIDFLGGNPDRPLVVGTVYNGANAHPYPLPDNKTQSGIKSDSVSGDGSNELRFEDQAGAEEVYIHCQKDFTIATENDKNQTTGQDETLTIGNDRTKEVGHDQRETVKNDKTIRVEGNHTETIVKDMMLTVEGNRSVKIVKDHDETVSGHHGLLVEKTKKLHVNAESDEVVDKDKTIHVGGSFTTTCDGAVSISASLSATVEAAKDATVRTDKTLTLEALDDVNQSSGKKTTLTAGDDITIKTDKNGRLIVAEQLTIKVGEARFVMKKNGDISISGKNIDIKGSGAVSAKGSSVDGN
jgi:type VI secretion system secreted protein VgrG